MQWERSKLIISGEEVDVVEPIIVSASRRCDIPAFQTKKFKDDLVRGFTIVKNPFSGKPSYISFSKTRLFVFWTKNPKPFFPIIEILQKHGIHFYFQFTLNDYELEGYEKGLPTISERIKTFQQLSKMIGAEKVIWRFDPLLVTDKLSLDELFLRIENIAHQLVGFTNQLIFSFADILDYKKVKRNFEKNGINYIDFEHEKMVKTAQFLSALGKKDGLRVSTCSEEIDFSAFGISHNRCIDDRLIASLFQEDADLMKFIFGKYPTAAINPNYPRIRDRGQRKTCGCILSKDIGSYSECRFGCVYCYAR
jgi:hypothetical protein